MDHHERAQEVAERVTSAAIAGDGAYVVSVLEGAFAAAVAEHQPHVAVTRTPESVRIDISSSIKPEAALLLMAEAQELLRVRVVAELVFNQRPMIVAPNGVGGTRGGDVQFRIGKVNDPKP